MVVEGVTEGKGNLTTTAQVLKSNARSASRSCGHFECVDRGSLVEADGRRGQFRDRSWTPAGQEGGEVKMQFVDGGAGWALRSRSLSDLRICGR
jgi:hypothetical protein